MINKVHFLRWSAAVAILLLAPLSGQAQSCSGPSDTPASRFETPGDGTVVDSQTGLQWKRCLEGAGGVTCEGGDDLRYYYEDARKLQGKYFANYSDWRIPTKEELETIVDKSCRSPAFNLEVFPNASNSQMWTSSIIDEQGIRVWVMYAISGVAIKGRTANQATVRLVRGQMKSQ